jgi:hypothetical protein
MLQHDLGPIRNLGRIAMTAGVKKSLSGEDLMHALLRHMRKITPHGECPPALDNLVGCRVLRVYRSSAGRPFWIITEADRTVTTVLMPEEFSPNLSCRNQNQF